MIQNQGVLKLKKQVTIADIAKKANVSPAAAARVILGTGKDKIRVSPETSRRIQDLARQMNYTPNKVAQQLAGKKSRVIGVLIDSTPKEINYQRLTLIEKIARSKGYRLLIGYEHPEAESIKLLINDFLSRGVEGLICIHHTYPGNTDTVAKTIMQLTDRVVFMDEPTNTKGALWAGSDYIAAGRIAAEHLVSRGYKRISLAIPDTRWYACPRVKAGYVSTIKLAGLDPADHLTWVAERELDEPVEFITPSIARRIVADLVLKGKADSIIVSDDEWAAMIIGELVEHQIRVPQDVAIVSIGNSRISLCTRPTITSIDLELKITSEILVNLLIDSIASNENPTNHDPFIPTPTLPKIVQREST